MKVPVIESKKGIMMNVIVSLKNKKIRVLLKMNTFGFLLDVTVIVIRDVKLINI